MQKIVFEDTTVVKSPYVTIDGVEYSIESGTYQGGTDLNANTFNTLQNYIETAINDVASSICPIGKVEVFFDNNDHSNYLGFIWERTSIGKMPIGIDSNDTDFDTIGKTGGEKTHTLTIDEIPNHGHDIATQGGTGMGAGYNYGSSGGWNSNFIKGTGGDQSHNNMPPYQVMALWKRVS